MTSGLVCVPVRDHVFSDKFRRLVRPHLKGELLGNVPPHLKLCEFSYENDPLIIARLVRQVIGSVNRTEFVATAIEAAYPTGNLTDFDVTLNVSKTGQIDLFHEAFCERYPLFTNPLLLHMTLELGDLFADSCSYYCELLDSLQPFSFRASSVWIYHIDGGRYWPVDSVLIRS